MTDDAEAEDAVELGDLTRSLGFLLRMAQLKAFDRFDQRLGDAGLRPGEFTVLWVIGRNPGLRQGSVARELRIKPAHMTKLIQRLAAAGHVARRVPAGDRRSVHLSLTDSGAAFVAQYQDAFLDLAGGAQPGLTRNETVQLRILLGKLTGLGGQA